MQQNNDVLRFSYDASGNVASVNYNGTEYYYLRNGQGDIVKLIDASGTAVVEYTYDTLGRRISVTGTMANGFGFYQPFGYRGYVYDSDWGFYYLQSRYYDPTTGRFISADLLLSTGQGVLGHNCYAYCLDNPVNMVDEGGARPAKGAVDPDGDDEENQRIIYDVPLYQQKADLNLCWAYCQVMIETWMSGDVLSDEEADNRAIQIAKDVFRSEDIDKWNRASYPHNKMFLPVAYGFSIRSIEQLYNMLEAYGPMYAYYKKPFGGAHYVILTGVDVSKNTVYTNNPWGYKGEQSFSDFKKGFYDGKGPYHSGMPLCKLYRVQFDD